MDRLIVHYWDRQRILTKSEMFIGKALATEIGGHARQPHLPHDIQYHGGFSSTGGVIGVFRAVGGAA